MLTCNCQHRVTDIQLSPAWNTGSHPPQGISLAGIRLVTFHAVFEKFLENCVFTPPCRVDIPASGKSWIPNCICWTIRFKYGTGKIELFERKTYYNQTMIMLILTFYHVEVWPLELGNCQTDDSCVKHRSTLLTPSLPWHVLDAINESLKEINHYNLTGLC